MATGEIDLKTLLVHDYKMIQSIAGTSRMLVEELEASHNWVTQSVSLFSRLSKISGNVTTLLAACEPHWVNTATAFSKPEVVKLWKTAAGLWSALPGEQKKFDEYAARRRRERIMGQVEEESLLLEEEQKLSDKAAYGTLLEEINATCITMLERLESFPDGLVPKVPAEEQADSDGQTASSESDTPAKVAQADNAEATPDSPTG